MNNTFQRLGRFLSEIRAPYFAAIALPIVLGTVIAWATEQRFNLSIFVLSLLAGIFLQAGANMTNDFFDQQIDEDPLQQRWAIIPPEQVLQGAFGFLVVGAMVGLYVALATGPLTVALGIIGIASGALYSAPPFRLSGTGIGELLAGTNLGLLTTVGAYYVQTLQVTPLVFWAATPVALLMAAALVLNGFSATKLQRGRSLWSRMGRQRGATAYAVPALSAYATLIVGVVLGHLPQESLLGLLGLPLAAGAVVGAQIDRFSFASASALAAHLGTTALLVIAFLLYAGLH
ncbi:MAG: prenyltransferase [Anaerolineales bacterium]|nr:prenyltransferase [Anaerolineales bacterium]MCB9128090.1 prenyltransferase [Ardenticatenales bacterium]MCB9172108.1 prenyltransferase [Ardenticatenales bacterium]